MLTPEYLDRLPDAVVERYAEAERTIMADMARRISKMGFVSDSTRWQLEKLQALGLQRREILRELAKCTGKSQSELKQLFNDASVTTLKTDDAKYTAAGYAPVPLKDNAVMQQLIWAGLEKTNGLFDNLTKTTAATATHQFERVLDRAHLQITSGAFDYRTAIRRAVTDLTGEGLRTIEYPSGRVDHLDVAVRRATLTGINQTAATLQAQRLKELDIHIVETSAHIGARNRGTGPMNHESWQGRRFWWAWDGAANTTKYPDFIATTGFGTGEGLCGWNCRHNFSGVPDDDAPLANTPEHLAAMNNSSVLYNGKKMSYYEATQQQRYFERQIRRWKRERDALDAAELDSSGARAKVREWQAAQRDFLDQTGMRRDYSREAAGKQYGESSRAGLAQVQATVSIPKEYDGNFDDFAPLTLNANEKETLLDLRTRSCSDGNEWAAVIADGKPRKPFTSGESDEVRGNIFAYQGERLDVFHSHTNVTPPSSQDFSFLLNPRVEKFGVIAYNKDAYIVSIGDGTIPSRAEFDAAIAKIKVEVNADISAHPDFAEWTLPERNYMAIREQAYRISQHFKWKLEGGRIDE